MGKETKMHWRVSKEEKNSQSQKAETKNQKSMQRIKTSFHFED